MITRRNLIIALGACVPQIAFGQTPSVRIGVLAHDFAASGITVNCIAPGGRFT